MNDQTKPTHHPSCRESDKDLVWHCSQCGLNESAADIEQQLAAEREQGVKALAERSFELAAAVEALHLISLGGTVDRDMQELAEDALAKLAGRGEIMEGKHGK